MSDDELMDDGLSDDEDELLKRDINRFKKRNLEIKSMSKAINGYKDEIKLYKKLTKKLKFALDYKTDTITELKQRIIELETNTTQTQTSKPSVSKSKRSSTTSSETESRSSISALFSLSENLSNSESQVPEFGTVKQSLKYLSTALKKEKSKRKQPQKQVPNESISAVFSLSDVPIPTTTTKHNTQQKNDIERMQQEIGKMIDLSHHKKLTSRERKVMQLKMDKMILALNTIESNTSTETLKFMRNSSIQQTITGIQDELYALNFKHSHN